MEKLHLWYKDLQRFHWGCCDPDVLPHDVTSILYVMGIHCWSLSYIRIDFMELIVPVKEI